jgi:hypothetical protein
MSAITDIPAKTARPMGNTESFFPGSVNVVCDEEDGDAAAAAADGIALFPSLLAEAETVGALSGRPGAGVGTD